ncbi:MAG: PAS domain S-box protein, partial [Pseudomonadota bacterium]
MSENLHHARFFWKSTAMLSILDFEGCFMEVNDAWEKKLGLSTSQLLSQPLLNFVHPEDQPATQYYLEQLQSGTVSTSFSCRVRHANGSYSQLLWEITAAASQSEAVYALALDISGRDQPSIADEIVGVLHDGVVLQYANGSIGACNSSAERIIGLPVEQMIGWTLVDPDWEMVRENGTPLPSEAHPAICALRTGEAFEDVIIGVKKPDSSELWLRMNAHPLWRDDVTTPYAVVISFSDITLYKETE